MPSKSRFVALLAAVVTVSSVATPKVAEAQYVPYGTDSTRRLVTGGLVASTLLLRQFVFAPSEVGPADFDQSFEGPGFDAIATTQYSPTWQAWTDRLLYGLMASAIGAAVVPGLSNRIDFTDALAMYGEVTLLTLGTTEVLKRAVARHRPYTYNTELDDAAIAAMVGPDSADARASFPSGHSSMAFASATFTASVLTNTYNWSSAVDAGVWTVTLGAATATAIGRVQAGKHFPSDVVVGALLGSAVGLLVPSCHEFGTGFCDLQRMQEGAASTQVAWLSIPIG
ncbi:MAG: phosphatase PAP2 family protein [Gemmatimonadota bacterium]